MPKIFACQKFVLSLQRVTEVITPKDTKKSGGDQRKHAPKTIMNQSKRIKWKQSN